MGWRSDAGVAAEAACLGDECRATDRGDRADELVCGELTGDGDVGRRMAGWEARMLSGGGE